MNKVRHILESELRVEPEEKHIKIPICYGFAHFIQWLYTHHGLDYNTPMEKIKAHQNSNMLWLYTLYTMALYTPRT